MDTDLVSTKAFPTHAAAEKDALNENSFRRRLVHLCQDEFFESVNIVSLFENVYRFYIETSIT